MNTDSSDCPADAMDRMMRNRGQAGSARDLDPEADTAEVNYETALSQTLGGGGIAQGRTGPLQGDASPGTLEQGGVSLPVASPFHSERIQTEVELWRRRPVTLDQDAQRVGAMTEDIGLGEDFSGVRQREPPYDQDQTPGEMQVRVARLEQAEDVARCAGEVRSAEVTLASRGIHDRSGVTTAEAITQGPTEFPTTPLAGTTAAGDALSERSRLSVAASGTRPVESLGDRTALGDRPLPGDPRELVPAFGTVAGSTELLLMQVLQENRFLKVRIEQMESQSSWHSGRTPTAPMDDQIPQGSPVSLAHPHVSAPVAEPKGSVPSRQEVQQLVPSAVYRQLEQLTHPSGVQSGVSGDAQGVQMFEVSALGRIPDQGLGVQSVVGQGLYGGGIGNTYAEGS